MRLASEDELHDFDGVIVAVAHDAFKTLGVNELADMVRCPAGAFARSQVALRPLGARGGRVPLLAPLAA